METNGSVPRLASVPVNPNLQVVGYPAPRADAPEKVQGTARYVNDMQFAGMLYASVVRSPHARARLLRVDVAAAEAIPGVRAVLTAKDIPGANLIPMVHADWPLLVESEARHVGEAVALIAADTPAAAQEAAAAVRAVYEPLPPLLDLDEAFERQEIIQHYNVLRGDVDTAFADPDNLILEATYHTPHTEHAYLETNGMVAAPDGLGGVVVYGSLQCPFYVRKAVASVLGVAHHKARVVQTTTGGGFGGKEDSPSLPGAIAALLAWKTKRPVKYVLSRDEDMTVMSKRHPGRMRYKMAVSRREGKMQAIEVDYRIDGGAYATLSPVVLWRGVLHAAGPYRTPNVRVHGYALRTNSVPCGAFRGFGQPQVAFACEAHVDWAAESLGLDPLEFRLRNLVDYGDVTSSGQLLDSSVGLREVVSKVSEAVGWPRQGRKPAVVGPGPIRRGIGIATTYYGVGLGAAAGPLNSAGANVVVAVDGSVTLSVGTTEMGQGMYTVLAQIAAETLECPLDLVRVVEPDTSHVPDSGPTVASRTTLMSGGAVRDACLKVKATMQQALEPAGLDFALMSWKERVKESLARFAGLGAQGWSIPPPQTFDARDGQGTPYCTYTWNATAAEVEVDTETGEVRPLRIVSGHDVGKVINPVAAEGQIEGGVLQGLGYALVEEHIVREGRLLNTEFTTYIIPTAMDTCEITPILVEHPFPDGPYGAKGLGETPLIGVAPAIVNAIAHATGVRLREIPATPERVWQAWRECREG